MFASAKGKQQKQVRQLQCQEQCIEHIPYYLSGLSRAHFSDNLSRNSGIQPSIHVHSPTVILQHECKSTIFCWHIVQIGRETQGYFSFMHPSRVLRAQQSDQPSKSFPLTYPGLFWCMFYDSPFYFCLLVPCSVLSSFIFGMLVFLFISDVVIGNVFSFWRRQQTNFACLQKLELFL